MIYKVHSSISHLHVCLVIVNGVTDGLARGRAAPPGKLNVNTGLLLEEILAFGIPLIFSRLLIFAFFEVFSFF